MIIKKISAIILLFWPAVLLAQIQWQTTHGNLNQGEVRLERNTITATVYPDYLDVEEEAEISTLGAINNTGDPNSLEIFGTFRLTEGSAIVGMLLWNGDIILKAKLKPRAEADRQYEEVVDRNIVPPPRPRDPALIESLGNDTYQMKIYPVILGNSRKIRLRYHVPCTMDHQGLAMNLRPVFGANIQNTVDNITVKLLGDDSETKYKIDLKGSLWNIDFPFVLFSSPKENIIISERREVHSLIAGTEFSSGKYQGNYLNLYANIPEDVLDYPGLNELTGVSLTANIANEYMNYSMEVNCAMADGLDCEPLEFHGKSQFVWNKFIEWRLFDGSTGETLETFIQRPRVISREADTSTAVLWASSGFPFSEANESYMGANYGFIDQSGSLLALEEDSLGREEQVLWEYSGVPRLRPVEIVHPDSSQMLEENENQEELVYGCMDPISPSFNSSANIHDPGLCTENAALSAEPDRLLIIENLIISSDMLRFTNPRLEHMEITIYDLKGKLVFRRLLPAYNVLEFALRELRAGKYFIRIKSGSQVYSR
ncbi:VIT domain-containing protein, partial [Fibrobacterota bacterium]